MVGSLLFNNSRAVITQSITLCVVTTNQVKSHQTQPHCEHVLTKSWDRSHSTYSSAGHCRQSAKLELTTTNRAYTVIPLHWQISTGHSSRKYGTSQYTFQFHLLFIHPFFHRPINIYSRCRTSCSRRMEPLISLPLQMAEHSRRAQPVSVANHVKAPQSLTKRCVTWLATESGWARSKRSAICSGKL